MIKKFSKYNLFSMKKSLASIILAFIGFLSFSPAFALSLDFSIGGGGGCSYDGYGSVQNALRGCTPKGSLTSDDYSIAGGVKEKIVRVTNQLILVGSILAVGGIVFAAVLYTSALGDGEKVKKAKTAFKFAITGFVLMLLSFPIVNALVNLIYGIG